MDDYLDSILEDDADKCEILRAYLNQAPFVRTMFEAITVFPDVPLPRDIEDARQELERAIWDWSMVWHIANQDR